MTTDFVVPIAHAKRPMTSCPASCSSHAATLESTPPDKAYDDSHGTNLEPQDVQAFQIIWISTTLTSKPT